MNSPRSPFTISNTFKLGLKCPETPCTPSSGDNVVKPCHSISATDIQPGLPVYVFRSASKQWSPGHIRQYDPGADTVQVELCRDKLGLGSIVTVSPGAGEVAFGGHSEHAERPSATIVIRPQVEAVPIRQVTLRNAQQAPEAVADLTALTPLSSPAVLECLERRYGRDVFYTGAGSALVVVNPFKDCTHLYGPEVIEQYHEETDAGLLASHVYRTAQSAYKGLKYGLGKANHSVIVSGESGAGKTVSAKHVMKYLVTVANTGSASSQNVGKTVERRILGSNPVLEAFGNASTLRNHNSSRFGKYIELQFDRFNQIEGATIQTYLLEKTRITHQEAGECNFHILYQLLQSSDDPTIGNLARPLDTEDMATSPQFTIAQCNKRSATQDKADWLLVKEAFVDIGFSRMQRHNIVKILCCLLHLGDLELTCDEDEEEVACVPETSQHYADTAALLLGVEADKLERTLTHKRITASHRRRQSVFYKPCTPVQAAGRRDCLARLIYARLFDWLVEMINKSMQAPSPCKTIGILDIYGFESFQINSLEQLCINYANEKLQQHYVTYFLRDLQMDYAREAIPWTFTEFQDNRMCLDLLEAVPGLFAILDEECQLNRPSNDEPLNERILDTLGSSCHLARARKTNCAFVVKHYAEPVQYSVQGLVEKNKDDVPPELVELLQDSDNVFVAHLFKDVEVQQSAGSKKKKSVLAKFKSSLDSLMLTLEHTQPHYIRCIKPNTHSRPHDFHQAYVLSQLQACGVIETVEISRQAFPARLSYEDFLQQYGLILRSNHTGPNTGPNLPENMTLNTSTAEADDNKENELLFDPLEVLYRKQLNMSSRRKSSVTPKRKLRRRAGLSSADHTRRLCASIMKLVFSSEYSDQPTACAQFGKTKIFLKDGQLEKLESVRASVLSTHVFTIQCAWRRHCQRRRLGRARAITSIQAALRGWLQRQRLKRHHQAASVIQRTYRRHVSQKRQQRPTSGTADDIIPGDSTPANQQAVESSISVTSPFVGTMVSNTCSSHARSLEHTPEVENTPFYTPVTSKKPRVTHSDQFQTPPGPNRNASRLRFNLDDKTSAFQQENPDEEEFLLEAESTAYGITYHVRNSPHRGYPGGRSARNIYHTVASAISAAFLTRRRFNLSGALSGIPYFEANDGIISRRRLPRVQIKFHTRANAFLKYGHYIHQREFQCSLNDCVKD